MLYTVDAADLSFDNVGYHSHLYPVGCIQQEVISN